MRGWKQGVAALIAAAVIAAPGVARGHRRAAVVLAGAPPMAGAPFAGMGGDKPSPKTAALEKKADQLEAHAGGAVGGEIQVLGGPLGEINDPAGVGWSEIVDPDLDGAAVGEIDHAHHGAQRQRAMRCGHGSWIEGLAAGGAPTRMRVAVPRGEADLCEYARRLGRRTRGRRTGVGRDRAGRERTHDHHSKAGPTDGSIASFRGPAGAHGRAPISS